MEEADTVLVELGLVEQRYRAVLDAWVRHYNIARPHQALATGRQPTGSRWHSSPRQAWGRELLQTLERASADEPGPLDLAVTA